MALGKLAARDMTLIEHVAAGEQSCPGGTFQLQEDSLGWQLRIRQHGATAYRFYAIRPGVARDILADIERLFAGQEDECQLA